MQRPSPTPGVVGQETTATPRPHDRRALCFRCGSVFTAEGGDCVRADAAEREWGRSHDCVVARGDVPFKATITYHLP